MFNRIALLCVLLISTSTFAANKKTPAPAKELTLTIGGDINFNVSGATVSPDGAARLGGILPWDYFTSGIAHLINGDLNFANIESVVTEYSLPTRVNKSYNFQSHTNSIRHLISLGFNLFSLANNHAYDYGFPGYNSTLNEMAKLKNEQPRIAYHGVGVLHEALNPVVFKIKGVTVAFAAVGIMDGTHHASAAQAGMINPLNVNLRAQLLANMRAVQADYKILSVHYGTENQTSLDGGQQALFQQMLFDGDIDMIIGHHPHVTRPVELIGNKVIFYSLGNYLMLGARDTGSLFGLFAKARLVWDESLKRMKLAEVQAIPLVNMHIQPMPYADVGTSALLINRLNELGRSQLGGNAMNFQVQPNGFGLYRAQ